MRARRNRKASAAALAVSLLAGACGRPDEARLEDIVIDVSELPRWGVVEDLRIGGRTPGGSGSSFVAAGPVVAGSDGRIYIGQWQSGEVRVYDPAGKYLQTIRPPASDASEPAVFNMGWLGDTLYVTDMSRRITYFSPDGEARGTGAVLGRFIPGTLYASGMAAPLAVPSEYTVQDGKSVKQLVVEVSRDGRVADTLGELAMLLPMVSGTTGGEAFSIPAPQPYRDHALRFATGDGETYYEVERAAATAAGPAQFRVVKHSRIGQVLWERAYGYTPVATEAQAVDAAVQETMSRLGAASTNAQIATQLRSLVYRPAFQPPVRQIRVDLTGFWMQREAAASEERWDRFDAAGEPLGRMSLPAGVTPALFTEDRVYAWVPDANGVLALVGYRIQKGN